MNYKNFWYKCLLIFVVIKLLVLLICTFFPFRLPHVWRQTDTMSVSLRYWQRWSQENITWKSILPARLDSGDSYGYLGQEFPLINIITAPFFSLGVEKGRIFAFIFLILLHFILTLYAYKVWKNKFIYNINLKYVALSLPVLSISSSYIGKFMGDYISMICVFIALGLSWENPQKKSLLWLSIGLLIKPLSIALLCMLGFQNYKQIKRHLFLWIIPSIIITFIYYFWGLSYIEKISERPGFGTNLNNPIENIMKSFIFWKDTLKIFITHMIFPFVMPLILFFLIYYRKIIKGNDVEFYKKSFIILFFMFFLIYSLRGEKINYHYYYLISISPLAILIFWKFLNQLHLRFLHLILFVIFLGRFIELNVYEFGVFHNKGQQERAQMNKECSLFKKKYSNLPWNQSYVFRTKKHNYPILGLCFGERVYSKSSEFGFYLKNEEVPTNCEIIEAKEVIKLAKCNKN